MKSKIKVFVIGIDSATFDVIGPWVRDNKLPGLKSLVDNGCSGILESTVPPLSPVAWPSLYTGVNPGKHGIFDFVEKSGTGKGINFLNRSNCKALPLWHYLNRVGVKTGMVNVPMTFPPDRVDGFMISGLDAPDINHEYTYPDELKDKIRTDVGKYIIELKNSFSLMNDPEKYLDMMYEMIAVREKTVHYLMSNYPVDFFMVVFTATDRVQHTFWKYSDRNHPDYKPGLEDAIFRIYKKIDEAVCRILDRLDDSTAVVVASDHGMSSIYKIVDLNGWLMEKGYLHLKKEAALPGLRDLFRKVKKRIVKTEDSVWLDHLVDWSKTKAFLIGSWGNIFINQIGREPNGIVRPGNEYESVREDIIKELKQFKDTETGDTVINSVMKKEEIFNGEYLDHAPDIVVSFNEHYGCTKIVLDRGPNKSGTIRPGGPICADHHPNGLFIVKSPHVITCKNGMRAKITDIAPTILYMMDVPIPQAIDGRVLTEIFDDSYRGEKSVKYSDVSHEADSGKTVKYSDEDARKIAERLKNLGYIE